MINRNGGKEDKDASFRKRLNLEVLFEMMKNSDVPFGFVEKTVQYVEPTVSSIMWNPDFHKVEATLCGIIIGTVIGSSIISSLSRSSILRKVISILFGVSLFHFSSVCGLYLRTVEHDFYIIEIIPFILWGIVIGFILEIVVYLQDFIRGNGKPVIPDNPK